MRQRLRLAALFAGMLFSVAAIAQSPATSINPMIGSSNGGNGDDVIIAAPGASAHMLFVQSLSVDGKPHDQPWLTPALIAHGGTLQYTLGGTPNPAWGAGAAASPPSFPPPTG